MLNTWVQGSDGLEQKRKDALELADDELRVQVQAVCLEPADLARAVNVAPGGGLVGTVVACGPAATAFMDTRVLVAPLGACGECDTCRRGFATVCPARVVLGQNIDGGCAESVVANARWVTKLDDKLSIDGPAAALVAGPCLAAYALYARAGVSAGELMIVLGSGATAALLCQLGETRGATVVKASGPQSLSQVTDALSTVDAKDRPQRIFVCDSQSLSAAMQIASPGSILLAYQQSGSLEINDIVERELTVLGLSFGHPDLLTETAALVAKGDLDLSPYLRVETISSESASFATQAYEAGQCLVLQHAQD